MAGIIGSDIVKVIGHAFDTRLFHVGGTPVTVASVITFVAIMVAAALASRLLQLGVVRALKLRGVHDEGMVGVASRLTHYAVMFLGLGLALQAVGIKLAALFAAGAVLAIAIGFAMQNITQNFVSGVIILLERAIKPGDVLRVEGQLVKVTKMAIRTTHARTLDDEEIIVPNSSIVQSLVTNYTLRDSLYRLRTVVGVSYHSEMKVVRRVLEEAAAALPWRVVGKDPLILLASFGNSAVEWEVSVWINDPWAMRRRRSDLNEAIWWALKEAGVTIAFPQVDVHFDAPLVEALGGGRAKG